MPILRFDDQLVLLYILTDNLPNEIPIRFHQIPSKDPQVIPRVLITSNHRFVFSGFLWFLRRFCFEPRNKVLSNTLSKSAGRAVIQYPMSGDSPLGTTAATSRQ